MEKSSKRHMLLLILKTPMVFESVREILADLQTESIVIQGSQVAASEENQSLEVPMVGGFLRLLEKDSPNSKAVLTVMEDQLMNKFERRCEDLYGNLSDNKDLTAWVLPVVRSLGSALNVAV